MRHHQARRRLAGVAMLALVLGTGAARAQLPDETQRRAVAQALFEEAQKLMEGNNYSAACIKLEEVVRLQPGKIGAIMSLARCYEGEGKTASAWSRFAIAAESAKISGDARQKDAEKKVEELSKKLPKLAVIVVETTAALVGLSVRRDGVTVSAAQWGSAIPMDPGEHRIEVTAPGKKPWANDATLTEGQTTTVTIPELEPDVPLPAEKPKAPAVKPSASALPVATTSEPPSSAKDARFAGLERKTWGLVVGGAGLAGVVVGAITGGLAIDQHAALVKSCPEGRCSPAKRGEVDAYESMGMVSTVSLVAGGVVAAAGAVLWVTAPGARTAGVRLVPYAGPGGAGILGSF